MKDWVEIIIGVVVFGVLIVVHLADHIMAIKKQFDERRAAQEPTEDSPLYEAELNEPAVEAQPIRSLPRVQEAPRPLTTLPEPRLSFGGPAPMETTRITRAQAERSFGDHETRASARSTAIPTKLFAAPIDPVRSPILDLVRDGLKDRKSLLAAIVLQEVFGPPQSRRGPRRPTLGS